MISSATLAALSNNLVASAIAVYGLAMVTYAAWSARLVGRRPEMASAGYAAFRGRGGTPQTDDAHGIRHVEGHPGEDRLGAIGGALTALGFLLHLAGVVTRGLAAGRAPWGNMYEFAVVAALAVAGAYLGLLRREPVRALGVWLNALVVLILGLAITVLYTPAGALVPVLNSYWLVVHVAAAMTAGGMFTVGAVATVLYRLRLRAEERPESTTRRRLYADQLPAASTLGRIAHSAHLFAFPIWTFAVIAGAIWAENAWGRYWGWDPKETWAFITWIFYAAYLHAEATAGWRGRRASWLALMGYVAFLFNFVGVNMWIVGLHSYAGI